MIIYNSNDDTITINYKGNFNKLILFLGKTVYVPMCHHKYVIKDISCDSITFKFLPNDGKQTMISKVKNPWYKRLFGKYTLIEEEFELYHEVQLKDFLVEIDLIAPEFFGHDVDLNKK